MPTDTVNTPYDRNENDANRPVGSVLGASRNRLSGTIRHDDGTDEWVRIEYLPSDSTVAGPTLNRRAQTVGESPVRQLRPHSSVGQRWVVVA